MNNTANHNIEIYKNETSKYISMIQELFKKENSPLIVKKLEELEQATFENQSMCNKNVYNISEIQSVNHQIKHFLDQIILIKKNEQILNLEQNLTALDDVIITAKVMLNNLIIKKKIDTIPNILIKTRCQDYHKLLTNNEMADEDFLNKLTKLRKNTLDNKYLLEESLLNKSFSAKYTNQTRKNSEMHL